MAAYLLVAYQTALSEELFGAAQELARGDRDAEFVVLVPATPVGHLLVWEDGETMELARRRAEEAKAGLEKRGLRVTEARTGDPDPVQAIDDLLREGRYACAGIVISTLPPGVSRWLKLDAVSRVRRHYPTLRVEHVVGAAPEKAAAETAGTKQRAA